MKVFKYAGGDLGPSNPVQVFSTTTERVDRTQAYWFSAEVVENFYAPLDVRLSSTAGLDFGRTGSVVTAYVRNRSTAVVTLTIAPVSSETPPTGQAAIAGATPITMRSYDVRTGLWTETRITGATTFSIAPGSTSEIQFGIDRSGMTGAADTLYASFLRLTDSGGLMDLMLPVQARKTSLSGLWVGDIKISGVGSKAPGASGSTTPEAFPLRTILHIPSMGTPKLLSQVFVGQLASAPNDAGICTREALLKQDAKASAQRLVAAHMPLDRAIAGSGTVGLPGTLTCVVTVPYNDPTNPFVHQYHPDHDNRNARLQPLGPGGESYDITRTCTFSFTATPPAGSAVTSGWGSSVLGGNYTEVITGVHSQAITVTGTFELNRVSENGTLNE